MARVIITHVGTSALRCKALLERANFDTDALDRALQLERGGREDLRRACREDLMRGLRDTWQSRYEPSVRRMRSPAEIASLSLLRLQRSDRIVLLHPESAGGRFCADLVALALRGEGIPMGLDYPHTSAVEAYPVDGLKVTGDPNLDSSDDEADGALSNAFVRQGMASYVERVMAQYEHMADGDQLIFNITGSYKGLVPIARDMSLLLAASKARAITSEVCYLFETGAQLIHYGTLPLQLHWPPELVSDLDRASGDRPVRLDLLKTGGEGPWQSLFELVSDAPPLVRLSALGAILRAFLRSPGSGVGTDNAL